MGFLPWTGVDFEATPEMVSRLTAQPSVVYTYFIDSKLRVLAGGAWGSWLLRM